MEETTENEPTMEDFTLSLALVDALPVLFFGLAMIILGRKLASPLFFWGALICVLAGTSKVAWKLICALWGKDIPLLAKPFRVLMPAGFVLMIIGFIRADRAIVHAIASSARAFSLPGLLSRDRLRHSLDDHLRLWL